MNKRVMKEFISGLGSIVLVAAGFVFKEKITKVAVDLCNRSASYGDAVDAIMNSSMFSDAKKEALGLVKKDQDHDYYRAIVKVMSSTSFSDAKVDMIKILNQD